MENEARSGYAGRRWRTNAQNAFSRGCPQILTRCCVMSLSLAPTRCGSNCTVNKSKTPRAPGCPLLEKPKFCLAREYMAPAKFEQRTEVVGNIAPSYYICTTCENGMLNTFRGSGYASEVADILAGSLLAVTTSVRTHKIPCASAGSRAGRTGKVKELG